MVSMIACSVPGSKRAGRLVEEKDGGIFEKGARDSDALALADAEVAAPLTHRALESLRHFHDEIVGLRALGGLDDFCDSVAPGRP